MLSTAVRPPGSASLGSRVARLAEAEGVVPPYCIARTALFLSWAQLSWLTRAVHCNIGRSHLWVMPPGD